MNPSLLIVIHWLHHCIFELSAREGKRGTGGAGLEVHRILKIRTFYSRILSSILKGLPHLGIEYFRVPESLVKLNDLVGIEYLEVPESLVVPNDLVGVECLEVPKSLVVSNDLIWMGSSAAPETSLKFISGQHRQRGATRISAAERKEVKYAP